MGFPSEGNRGAQEEVPTAFPVSRWQLLTRVTGSWSPRRGTVPGAGGRWPVLSQSSRAAKAAWWHGVRGRSRPGNASTSGSVWGPPSMR